MKNKPFEVSFEYIGKAGVRHVDSFTLNMPTMQAALARAADRHRDTARQATRVVVKEASE